MTIFSPNPVRFIEDALFCSDPFALSYSDPDQKWIIRQHLLSLLNDFPSLRPSVSLFTHNDGTAVTLLLATGDLPVSPPVPLTIWVHELYPHVAPLVYINAPIHGRHPFADPTSGATTSAYTATWHFSKSSLAGLAHNLTRLFCHNHPLCWPTTNKAGGYSDRWAHPSLASRMEASDRLACSLYYDSTAILDRVRREVEELAAVQAALRERSEGLAIAVRRLEGERRGLKSRSDEMCEEVDRLQSWLRVNATANSGCAAVDDVFEGADGWSETAMDLMAADQAVEDLMYKLEAAVGAGVVSFGVYLKQEPLDMHISGD
ncbi:protein ELC isoform X2 [Salvia hispanica]|uniref:protein ELC isoform X2 n=1 Tax=Salvia hispanica TaxID=49212 RepID=UPI00200954CF|nr:protein ELC isoform X2 [Salvia hispanica]